MQGRIKLHRKAQSNPISTNLELRGLFTFFLTKANHSEGSFFHGQQKIDLLPGQFIRSMQGIADHFSISKPKAYRLTELLEKSEIVIRKGYSKYTLFTIVNRGLYQSEGNAIVTRSETPPYTNNNDKNKKEGKEIKQSDFFEQFWKIYPRKIDKEKSSILFHKHIKAGIDPNVIIAGAEKYALSKIGTEKEYIKHATTRLNGKNRSDDVEINIIKTYELYIADGRDKEIKWSDYCNRYTEKIMLQAQAEYQQRTRQSFIL